MEIVPTEKEYVNLGITKQEQKVIDFRIELLGKSLYDLCQLHICEWSIEHRFYSLQNKKHVWYITLRSFQSDISFNIYQEDAHDVAHEIGVMESAYAMMIMFREQEIFSTQENKPAENLVRLSGDGYKLLNYKFSKG